MDLKEREEIIANEIKELRVYYRQKWCLRGYKNINHGYCEYFAEDLRYRLNSLGIYVRLVNSDSLKLNPEDGDNSDWNSDAVLKVNLSHPKKISYEELNRLHLGYHVWVYDDVTKKHYDSETPTGVKCLFQLPIYKRSINKHLRFIKILRECDEEGNKVY